MEEDISKRRRISNNQIQKRAEEDEDRISALPDSLIHHILSFLPFEDAVNTCVLSKRWEFLWTWVQDLIFRFRSDYERFDEFSAFVNRALILYSPVKVNKFVVDFDQYNGFGSCVDFWVRFAITHDVEELFLHFLGVEDNDFPLEKAHDGACLPFYMLPQFIYESSSVSKLSFKFCNFSPEGQISWTLLKVLSIGYVELSDDVMQKILLGSPALEFLELYRFQGINRLDITSKRLKKLVVNEIWDSSLGRDDSTLEISAPNLLSLSILGYFFRRDCRLMNVSSLVDATFDFERMVYKEDIDNFYREHQNMVNQLLEKVCHVRELTLGSWCIQVVSIREVIRLPSPLSKCKCLILGMDCVDWDMPGVASLLHSSPEMEKLVINMAFPGKKLFDFDVDFYNSYEFEKNYWTSQKRILKCLLPHLETIEVVGLEESRPYYYEFALELMEFLLKNAKVLKKLVLMDNNHNDKEGRRHDLLQAAQKLSSFPRCSPHAVIRVPT